MRLDGSHRLGGFQVATTCHEFRRRLAAEWEEPAAIDDDMERHVLFCESCRRTAEGHARLREAIAAHRSRCPSNVRQAPGKTMAKRWRQRLLLAAAHVATAVLGFLVFLVLLAACGLRPLVVEVTAQVIRVTLVGVVRPSTAWWLAIVLGSFVTYLLYVATLEED